MKEERPIDANVTQEKKLLSEQGSNSLEVYYKIKAPKRKQRKE